MCRNQAKLSPEIDFEEFWSSLGWFRASKAVAISVYTLYWTLSGVFEIEITYYNESIIVDNVLHCTFCWESQIVKYNVMEASTSL